MTLEISPLDAPYYLLGGLLLLLVILHIALILLTLKTRSSQRTLLNQLRAGTGEAQWYNPSTISQYDGKMGVDIGKTQEHEEVGWAVENGAETLEEALEYLKEHKRQFGDN